MPLPLHCNRRVSGSQGPGGFPQEGQGRRNGKPAGSRERGLPAWAALRGPGGVLPLGQLQVEVFVLFGGVLPGDVLRHVPLDDLVPVVAVGKVQRLGPVDGVQQQAGFVPVEGKAVALPGEGVVGLHGVLQAAGLPHDGQGAVVHGVELGQAAGLKAGGHQQGVGAGVDAVGPGLVVLDAGAEGALVGVLIPPEGVLIHLVAGAQHHDLGVAVQHLGDDGADQIQALLVGQPGDEAKDELALVLLQAQLFLQGQLVLHLVLQHVPQRTMGKVP